MTLTTARRDLPAADAAETAPRLWPVFVFTWLNSLSGGCAGLGLFFVTKEGYHFSEPVNFALGGTMGAAYVLGALGVGPLLRRLAGAPCRLSRRAALVALMVGMGGVCALAFFVRSEWSVWVFAILYQALGGGLWPIVESYVSGGRAGLTLRRTIGAFNYVWASAIVAAFWLMAQFLKSNPLAVFGGVALAHFTCAAILGLFTREPARHLDDAHEPHPPKYERLLRCFRWLLVTSYILMYALSPALASGSERLGVSAEVLARIVSAWMISRVVMFVLLERWHGWHGRWRTAIWTSGAMLAGFAVSLLATSVPMLIGGLTLFGVGLGGVYFAALYYAMAVGSAEVEAGGKHEAIIGAGMSLGPFLGLGAWLPVKMGWMAESRVVLTMLALVGGLALVGVAAAVRASRRL